MNISAESEIKSLHQAPVAEGKGPIGREPNFVATLAHEIRNILSPLGGSLELLNTPHIDEATACRAREVIGRQVRQLQRLVNGLLDAHRAEHQQIQIMPSMTDISIALEAICEDHRPVFASREITLILDGITRPLWLRIDVDRLDQALNNLLNNSLKFTDRGGSVRVCLSVDLTTQFVTISVADTGIGIAANVLHSIFDPYAHDTSYRNASGLGLGLPLAKRLVELHGGQLTAQSEGVGKGAEFRILLPLPT